MEDVCIFIANHKIGLRKLHHSFFWKTALAMSSRLIMKQTGSMFFNSLSALPFSRNSKRFLLLTKYSSKEYSVPTSVAHGCTTLRCISCSGFPQFLAMIRACFSNSQLQIYKPTAQEKSSFTVSIDLIRNLQKLGNKIWKKLANVAACFYQKLSCKQHVSILKKSLIEASSNSMQWTPQIVWKLSKMQENRLADNEYLKRNYHWHKTQYGTTNQATTTYQAQMNFASHMTLNMGPTFIRACWEG